MCMLRKQGVGHRLQPAQHGVWLEQGAGIPYWPARPQERQEGVDAAVDRQQLLQR
jgi:hypothetical protein